MGRERQMASERVGQNMNCKEKFVRFLLESGALTFGDFTLKSGRKSPYMKKWSLELSRVT